PLGVRCFGLLAASREEERQRDQGEHSERDSHGGGTSLGRRVASSEFPGVVLLPDFRLLSVRSSASIPGFSVGDSGVSAKPPLPAKQDARALSNKRKRSGECADEWAGETS